VPYLVTARFGFMRTLGDFVTEDASLARRDWAVLQTHRGTEIGDVLVGPREVSRGQSDQARGRVVRRASADDLAKREAIERDLAVQEFTTCRRLARELSLPMKVVSVEHLFGGERLVFYFTSEGRVDFRRLVRELGRAFKTRVEMRQIGSRDEARLLGDVGRCGLTLCCRSFLRELEPVTMRMARSQKATLNPGKISGACGRLMCCLRYEDETYRSLKKTLPPLGAVFELPEGQAEVTGHEILARRVLLTLESGRRVAKRADELPDSLRRREAEQSTGAGDARPRPRRRGRGGAVGVASARARGRAARARVRAARARVRAARARVRAARAVRPTPPGRRPTRPGATRGAMSAGSGGAEEGGGAAAAVARPPSRAGGLRRRAVPLPRARKRLSRARQRLVHGVTPAGTDRRRAKATRDERLRAERAGGRQLASLGATRAALCA